MRPSLPNRDDFIAIVYELWETRMLSNFAKYSQLMEQSSKEYFNSDREFLSVVSCDIGLNLILRAYDFPRGSEVLVPSFTFNSTPNNIALNGLKPVFVDIDPHTFNIDSVDAEKKITSKTVAILGVHVFGNPCDVKCLTDIAETYNLKLFFDAAHAFGSKTDFNPICEYGDAGAYSFSGTKLITSAEGGLVYFKDKEMANRFKKLRNYGFEGNYNTEFLGMNGKISEFHAALAHLSIKDIDHKLKERIGVAYRYLDELKNCQFQTIPSYNATTFKDFAVIVENREKVVASLEESGIQTKQYFFPNHLTDYYKDFSMKLPVTENIYNKIICLPIFNDITDEQVDLVIREFNKEAERWI